MLDLSLGSDIYKSTIFEAAAQEVDLIFYTTNTELIGYPSFGTNFDDFLWTLTSMTGALQQYIEEKLMETVFVTQLKHHIQINYVFNESTYENIYNVRVILYDDFNSVEKTYKLNEKV